MLLGIDPEKYVLGTLCSRKHEWEQSGKSLRYTKNGTCSECLKIASKTWKDKNKSRIKEYNADYWKSHPTQRPAEYYRGHYQKDKEGYKRRKAKWQSRNHERYLKQSRNYASRTWRFFYYKNKAQIDSYRRQRKARIKGLVNIPYTAACLEQRSALFNNQCAYCGADFIKKGSRCFDHVVPVSKKGDDAIYNLVPACRSCNGRKGASDMTEWYTRQDIFIQSRFDLILWACGQKHKNE